MNWYALLLFYILLLSIFLINYKKVERQGLLLLLKVDLGTKYMKLLNKNKYTRKIIDIFGILSYYLGFLLMFVAIYFLIKSIILNIPSFYPVLPGMTIPKTNITVPVVEFLIGVFVLMIIHEFAHGVLSVRYRVPIKRTGILLFGPLFGAFVEPDEKKLMELDEKKQIKIYNAGSSINVIFAFIILLISSFIISPLLKPFIKSNGVIIEGVIKNSSAYYANITPGEKILYLNGVKINNYSDFLKVYSNLSINETINLTTNRTSYIFQVGSREVNYTKFLWSPYPHFEKISEKKPFIGVYLKEDIKEPFWVSFIKNLFMWLFILNLGVGIANMLPIYGLDGGRTLYAYLKRKLKNEEKAWKITSIISILVILCIIYNLILGFI